MALRIIERGEVVKGVPVVQLGDDLFWFNRPSLILYLINFVLFQNAFQLAFFAWTWYEFGLKSCFHEHTEDIVIRISMGVLIYRFSSLQLRNSTTLCPRNTVDWHHPAPITCPIKQNSSGVCALPMSSRPTTPSHHLSPVHLLRYHRNEMDSVQTSPRRSNFDIEHWETDSPSPSHRHRAGDGSSSYHHNHQMEQGYVENDRNVNEVNLGRVPPIPQTSRTQHEIDVGPKDFSFDKRTTAGVGAWRDRAAAAAAGVRPSGGGSSRREAMR
uniref:MLO-like protein n=1 Tax=Fagus sylvatica TaxID=28930 RepID=A0A2N9HPS7_FAGSY